MRNEKLQLVQDIGEEIRDSGHIVLVHYKGLKVEEFNGLREGLDEVGARCRVVPNGLFRRAAKEYGWEHLAAESLQGDTAVIVGGDDVVAVAKKIMDFSKEHEALQVKKGALDGKLLGSEEVEQLANLPPREVLLSQLLSVLQAPGRNLASVLQQKAGSVVYALQAYLEKQKNSEE